MRKLSQTIFSDPSFERARCKFCGRPLKARDSVAAHAGKVCARRDRMQKKIWTEEEMEACAKMAE
jgi:hypothetical protein